MEICRLSRSEIAASWHRRWSQVSLSLSFIFLSLEVATPFENNVIDGSKLSPIRMQGSTHEVPKSASQVVLSRMQLTLRGTLAKLKHLTALVAW